MFKFFYYFVMIFYNQKGNYLKNIFNLVEPFGWYASIQTLNKKTYIQLY